MLKTELGSRPRSLFSARRSRLSNRHSMGQGPSFVTIQVFDEKTREGIGGADITVRHGQRERTFKTNPTGVASLNIAVAPWDEIDVTIQAAGYVPITKRMRTAPTSGLAQEVVLLSPESARIAGIPEETVIGVVAVGSVIALIALFV